VGGGMLPALYAKFKKESQKDISSY
jgi:hypothetical protein